MKFITTVTSLSVATFAYSGIFDGSIVKRDYLEISVSGDKKVYAKQTHEHWGITSSHKDCDSSSIKTKECKIYGLVGDYSSNWNIDYDVYVSDYYKNSGEPTKVGSLHIFSKGSRGDGSKSIELKEAGEPDDARYGAYYIPEPVSYHLEGELSVKQKVAGGGKRPIQDWSRYNLDLEVVAGASKVEASENDAVRVTNGFSIGPRATKTMVNILGNEIGYGDTKPVESLKDQYSKSEPLEISVRDWSGDHNTTIYYGGNESECHVTDDINTPGVGRVACEYDKQSKTLTIG